MLSIRTILHPTDFSECSRRALHLACAMARDYHARLILLHVVPQPRIGFGEGILSTDPAVLREEAESRFDQLILPDCGLDVEHRIAEGDPVATTLQLAEELPADLVIMGTHGRTGLKRFVAGSVAEQVVRRARCPVLTVTSPLPATAGPDLLPANQVEMAAV